MPKTNPRLERGIPVDFIQQLAPSLARKVRIKADCRGEAGNMAVTYRAARRAVDKHDVPLLKAVARWDDDRRLRNNLFVGISGVALVNAALLATTTLWPLAIPVVLLSGAGALLAGNARATDRQVALAAFVEASTLSKRIVEGLSANPGQTAYPYESELLDQAVALHAKGADLQPETMAGLRDSFVRHFVSLVGDDARQL